MKKPFKLILSLAIAGTLCVSFLGCNNNNEGKAATSETALQQVPESENVSVEKTVSSGKVNYITTEEFSKNIFDFKNSTDWKYLGKEPCIIDFYATWCGPCKRVAPIMDELAKEYEGKIKFYKVDTDKERELAGAFGIQSIPSILFIPATGKPQMTSGAYPKEQYIEMINNIIYSKK